MTYQKLLSSVDWSIFRMKILVRDKFKCNNCSNKSIINQENISFHALTLFYEDWTSGNINTYKESPPELASWSFAKVNEKFFYNKFTFFDFIKLTSENRIVFLCVATDSNGIERENGIVSISNFPSGYDKTEDVKKILNNQTGSTEWHFSYGLNVHHTYYVDGLYPWLYPKDTLVTLCSYCHEELHKYETIPHYNKKGELIGKINPFL